MVLAIAPAAHRRFYRILASARARLSFNTGSGGAARRKKVLLGRVVEEVVRKSGQAFGALPLPDSVEVGLSPTDIGIVVRDEVFVEEMNRELLALAAAEGWSAPQRVRIEVVPNPGASPGRPRLTVAYDDAQDLTPLESGPYLITPDHHRVDLPLGQEIVIGRGDADIQLDQQYVSRHHLALTARADGGVEVRDLGSANRTYLDGVALTRPVVVRGSAEIGLGRRCAVQLRWAP